MATLAESYLALQERKRAAGHGSTGFMAPERATLLLTGTDIDGRELIDMANAFGRASAPLALSGAAAVNDVIASAFLEGAGVGAVHVLNTRIADEVAAAAARVLEAVALDDEPDWSEIREDARTALPSFVGKRH